jgi:IS1 family transposase
MNCLSVRQRAELLSLLCEGCSLATITRHTGAHKMTILSLLKDAGAASAAYLDARVRGVVSRRVQADEIWSFCYMKEKRVPEVWKGFPGLGDVWLWLAICTESKLAISYHVGCRGGPSATAFIKDLASRLTGRIQLSTDGHRPYIEAVAVGFGSSSVDYAMIAKHAIVSETDNTEMVGYSVFGEPDPYFINTSYIERYNLTIRMTDRRYTRKTNGFSKSIENHKHSVALHVLYYNFVRVHMALKTTPAVSAGLADRAWYYEDIIEMIDKRKRDALKPSGVVRIKRNRIT